MKKRIKYADAPEPMDNLVVVKDFLPSPDQLVFREDTVKVTLALSTKSVDFFKTRAARHGTQYQRMIRRLLDTYVEAHTKLAAPTKKPARGRLR